MIVRKIIMGLILLVTLNACDSLLDIEPRQSVDAVNALKTAEGISASLTDIYSYWKNVVLYGRDYVATSEALADNARIINRAGGRYQNQGSNAPNSHFTNWATAYVAINEVNLLLEALPLVDMDASKKNEVEGQAAALRALLYFDLMRAYAYEPGMEPSALQNKGGVPLMLKGVLAQEQIELPARATQQAVYAQIYADLTVATAKAPREGAPVYISKVAAHAFFAKVALYNRDWAKAEEQATLSLTEAAALKKNLSSKANYVADWRLVSHPESLFEVLFKNASENIGVNESVQSAFTTRVSLTSASVGGYGAVVPTQAFLDLIPAASDVRNALYQLGLPRSGSTVTECTKFMGKTGTLYMDNIPVIRLSEVYLIRAEARARNSNEQGARDDLNQIAERGTRNYTAINATGTSLINAILLERRLELAFEGDRWFDLKRRGQDVIKSTGNVLYDDYRILAPLPVREIQSNPNLNQNFSY